MKDFAIILAILLNFNASAMAQRWDWANGIGNSEGAFSYSSFESIASFQDSGMVVAGTLTTAAFQWGDILVPESGDQQVLVAALSASGEPIWISFFGEKSFAEVTAIVSDASGNVYVSGSFSASQFIAGSDTILKKDGNDAFLVKLSPQGEILWSMTIATDFSDFVEDMSVDVAGNVYLAGYAQEFGTMFPKYEGFFCKISPDAQLVWSKKIMPIDGYLICSSIKIDEADNIFIAGQANTEIVLNELDTILISGERGASFVLRCDSSGRFIQGFSDTAIFYNVLISLSDNHLYLTGGSYHEDEELFYGYLSVRSLDKDFNESWYYRTSLIPDNELYPEMIPHGISSDAQGNVYILGVYRGAFDCGRGFEIATKPVMYSIGNDNSFFTQLDQDGNPKLVHSIGDSLSDWARSIALLNDGKLAIVGAFSSDSLLFGSQSAVNQAPLQLITFYHGGIAYMRAYSAFVAKFDPNDVVSHAKNSSMQSISLYPNPSQDHFYLRSEVFSESPVQVQLFSTGGKLLSQQHILPMGNSIRVETAALPPGLYVVGVIVDGQVAAERFVKF